MKENALIDVIKELDSESDEFFGYIKRPKKVEKVIAIEKENNLSKDIAIIMQGPLVKDDNFTVETVKIYKKIYPGVLVIVSTWKDEDVDIISELTRQDNCLVVLNDYPLHSGIRNTNYQIVSTLSGLKKAKECGKKYSFKTRCDFRFYKIGILDFMVHLLYQFPVCNNIKYQKCRIINGNVTKGGILRAWWLGDQYVFGLTDDMLNYWNYTLDDVDISVKESAELLRKEHYTYRRRIEERLAGEPNIVRDYFRRNEGELPNVSIKAYFEKVKNNFIMISGGEIGAYWQKYDMRFVESVRNGTYCSEDSEEKLQTYDWNFVRWLNLYYGSFAYDEEYEKYMDINRY